MKMVNQLFVNKVEEFKQEYDLNTNAEVREVLGCSAGWFSEHRNNSKLDYQSKVSAERLAMLKITQADLDAQNAQINGLGINERIGLKQQVNTAFDQIIQNNGEHIQASDVLTRLPENQYSNYTVYSIINEIAENRDLQVSFPSRTRLEGRVDVEHSEEILKPVTSETKESPSQRIQRLKHFYTGNGKSRKEKIKRLVTKSPFLMLGDAYQGLAEAALGLANLDDRVYDETALTYEKEDGKLTRTRNIVDYLVLQGYNFGKSNGNGKDKKIVLNEVKLGRQRQGILKQVKGQLNAAKSRWPNKNISLNVIVGSQDDMYTSFPGTDAHKRDLRELNKHAREFDERARKLESLDRIFEREGEVTLVSLPEVLEQVEDTLYGKSKELMRNKTEEFDGKSFLKNAKRLHRISGTEETKKLVEVLKDVQGSMKEIEQRQREAKVRLVVNSLDAINRDLQSRALSVDQIRKYDENLYLFSKYLSRFKKHTKGTRLRGYRGSPLKDVGNALVGILELSHTMPDEIREEANFDNTEKYVKPIMKVGNFLRKIVGKEPVVLNIEDIKKNAYGLTQEEFWKQYLPDSKNLLEQRRKLKVHYEENGLHQPFSEGLRAIPKHARNNKWVLKALESIGVETDDLDLSKQEQLTEALDILDEFKKQTENSYSDVAEAQRKNIENLETQVSRLERLTEKGNIRSDTNPRFYEQRLSELEVEERSIKGLKKQRLKDNILGSALIAYSNFRSNVFKLFRADETGISVTEEDREEHKKLIEEKYATPKLSLRARVLKKVLPDVHFDEIQVDAYDYHGLRKINKLRNFLKKSVIKDKVDRINGIYKGFLSGKDPLEKTQKQTSDYLTDEQIRVVIDKERFSYLIRFFSKFKAPKRSNVFRKTHLIERYTAAKLLETTEKAQSIGRINPELGQEYLARARQEYRTSKDLGSEEIVKGVLESVRGKYEQSKQNLTELVEVK